MTLFALIALGSVVAMDATSLGQLMLSRPLVAGTLAGALVGIPLEGALLGGMLEALSLSILPVGAAKYPETGTAAVAGVGTLGLAAAAPTPATLLLVLVYAITWQRIAGWTARSGRHVNEKLLLSRRPSGITIDRLIDQRNMLSLLLDMMRGALVTVIALGVGVPLMRAVVGSWDVPFTYAAVAIAMAAAAVLAGTAPLFCVTTRARAIFAAGVALGGLLLLIR